jgi:polyhydroxyalkanoate synthesis regulator phasin
MGTPAVLIRKSTGEIIKHADYPREDMQPISGLDPDLEWLIKYKPFVAPDYDSRIFVLNQTEEMTAIPHPDYPLLNQYRITFSTTKRVVDEIKVSIENAEREANENIFPYAKQLKILTLGLGVLFRRVEGMTLTTKETAVKDKILKLAVNVWKNDQALQNKIKELTAGLEPNIDEGWEKIES